MRPRVCQSATSVDLAAARTKARIPFSKSSEYGLTGLARSPLSASRPWRMQVTGAASTPSLLWLNQTQKLTQKNSRQASQIPRPVGQQGNLPKKTDPRLRWGSTKTLLEHGKHATGVSRRRTPDGKGMCSTVKCQAIHAGMEDTVQSVSRLNSLRCVRHHSLSGEQSNSEDRWSAEHDVGSNIED